MLCPFCGSNETEVYNSRATRQDSQIWRRRRCLPNKHTFSSYEQLDMGYLTIIKSEGRHEAYNRTVLVQSLLNICSHDNSLSTVEGLSDTIETRLIKLNKPLVYRSQLMQLIARTLKNYDYTLLLRFVSQHEAFGSARELNAYLKQI